MCNEKIKYKINKKTCISCGICSSVNPNLFKMEVEEEGLKSKIIKFPNSEEEKISYKNIQKMCPTKAIL